MPLRPLVRDQAWLLPPTLNDLLPEDHPARFVAAFVDELDTSARAEMEIDRGGDALGAPAYHPDALLGVWLYGHSDWLGFGLIVALCAIVFIYGWFSLQRDSKLTRERI